MSVEALKRDVERAIAAQEWGIVSDLSAQIKSLQDGSPTLSPASTGTEGVRQTSSQEHSATLRAQEEQRQAEAEEAELEGELSRTRAEFVAALRDGTPTPMSRPQLRQSISRVFDDETEAQFQWSRLEPTMSFELPGGFTPGAAPVGFEGDLALEPLQWANDDSATRRALGSVRKSFLERNLSAELRREGSGGMSARSYGLGPMSTASGDLIIDTPLPDGMSLLYNEVAQEQAAARSAWETQQYSMDRLWGLPSISDDVLPEQKSAARAPQNRVPAAAPGASGRAAGSAGGSAAAQTDRSMLPPPPGLPDTRPAHVIDPTWGRVGRSYSQSKPKVTRTGRASGETDRHSGGKAGKAGKKEKKRRVVVKDPNKPKPTPWSDAELAHFRHLLDTEGPNAWAAKAAKLGTGRTAKSLHTRWLRDEGRIVDKPRGMAAMREAGLAASKSGK